MNTKISDTISIRRARPDLIDATLLRDTEQHTLGDSDLTAQEILDVLYRPEHVTYLACAAGSRSEPPTIAGFLSCFYTLLRESEPCLEADMLGVRPAFRRQGIATALIREAVAAAEALGVRRMRSVIAKDNVASQGAFGRAGFSRTEPLRVMLVHELDELDVVRFKEARNRVTGGGLARAGALAAMRGERHELSVGVTVIRAACLSVQTLAYRGLWLEELSSATPRHAAMMGDALARQALTRQLDEVGYLVPLRQPSRLQALQDVGYREVGRYWVYRREAASS